MKPRPSLVGDEQHLKSMPAPSQPKRSALSHKLVQCPSCTTRYAVETTVLQGSLNPKFHCSKCDTVFSLQLKDMIEIEYMPSPSVAEREEDSLKETASPSSTESSSSLERNESSLFSSITSTTASSKTTDSFPPPPAPTEQVMEKPEAFSPGESEEVKEENLEQIPSVPFEIPTPKVGFSVSAPHEESLSEPREQIPLNFEPPQKRRTGRFPFFKVKGVSGGDLLFSIQREENTKKEEQLPVSPWRGFIVLSVPIIGFLIVLFLSALYLSSHVQEGREWARSLWGDTVLRIPPGVIIKGASLKKVTLDTGETIFVVSGKTQNDSESAIKEIVIQGILFNGNGEVIGEAKGVVGSSLTKAELSTLSLQLVRDLQAKAPSRRFELKIGEEGEFRIAISEQELASSNKHLSDAKYFSARIFSTKSS